MKAEYREWIRHNVPACPRGLCDVMTQTMVDAFPELRRVKGYVDDIDGEHPHWWCVTDADEIIDPTASQFVAPHNYREHVGPEPIGKCINCGDYIYPGSGYSVACSEACGRALEAEFNALAEKIIGRVRQLEADGATLRKRVRELEEDAEAWRALQRHNEGVDRETS